MIIYIYIHKISSAVVVVLEITLNGSNSYLLTAAIDQPIATDEILPKSATIHMA